MSLYKLILLVVIYDHYPFDQLLRKIDMLAEREHKKDREGNWDPAVA